MTFGDKNLYVKAIFLEVGKNCQLRGKTGETMTPSNFI